MFHTKPCVVSAFQYDGDLMNSEGTYYVPQWAQEAYLQGVLHYVDQDLYMKQEYCASSIPVPVGYYIALLPNNAMIAIDPIAFNWIFEKSETEGR